MSQNSSIEWTDATWNPVRGCTRVSPGCVNCYAERQAARFSREGAPFDGFVKLTPSGPRWTGKVGIVEKHLLDPLHWRDPRMVFVNSMSDLFHEDLTDEAIDRVFAVMALCPQHTFQVLTKRAKRMREYCSERTVRYSVSLTASNIGGSHLKGWHSHEWNDPAFRWPIPNVWLGVSAEDQQRADERIPDLLDTPAAVRFVSYEPALGPVDFRAIPRCMEDNDPTDMIAAAQKRGDGLEELRLIRHGGPGIHWIIFGGESGPRARPSDVKWARDTVRQCRDARVACFVKQFGARPYEVCGRCRPDATRFCKMFGPDGHGEDGLLRMFLKDRKGGEMSEWPEDTRVREFPKGAK